ncbi:hypothetical protein AT00_09210 [Pseudoalteromonas lipolytica SCSIO 04301]|uniref:ThiF family adenylyltransferase n=1 Tax=Pseudoalteromonas TaxID=53246 RepID=UPI000452C12F|nr:MULTISPECIES: ThiF family adenylyltransferase [Pseudoalteromonas]EWH06181.1 hypothetical protein AT00_09210 [Pseudoalteromonas lipolytica SCSIO 04301]QMW16863.1 ThiF family adenylyltransferase [Pseudoalteromonas sp. MT33b]
MSQQLINLSSDLKRLQNEGYELTIQNGHVLLSNVPYVNSQKEVKFGTLVSDLTLNGNVTKRPSTHVIHFIGEQPCNADGSEIQQIIHIKNNTPLTGNLVANRSFSNKPNGGYSDYYHKFTQYVSILQNPAQAISPAVSAQTYKPIESYCDDDIFKYIDTNSCRAGITAVSAKLESQRIGIVGLGGTGSYILDFVSKTPVSEIHLIDGDEYCQHNAFRSPGSTSLDELNLLRFKVEHHKQRYDSMRNGIFAHPDYLTEQNLHLIEELDFVFICIDSGSAKKEIFKFLKSKSIPFIDVGLGIQLVDEKLTGIVRTTLCTTDRHEHLSSIVSLSDANEDDYSSNIQIAELNGLNAAFAVIRWKKLLGFYHDHNGEHNSTYTINANMLLGDEEDEDAA